MRLFSLNGTEVCEMVGKSAV